MIDRYGPGQAPSPDTVAAWFVLGVVPKEQIPWWAAQWLVDGHDGAALRELAGLDGRDPREVTDLLPEALAEAGAAPPATYAAAASNVFGQMAEQCLSGRVDERRIAQEVEDIVGLVGFDEDVRDLPLGRLYGVADYWGQDWAPPIEELRRDFVRRVPSNSSDRRSDPDLSEERISTVPRVRHVRSSG